MVEPVDGRASGRLYPKGLLRVRIRHSAPAGGLYGIALAREQPDGLGQPQGELFHLLNVRRLHAAGISIREKDLLGVRMQVNQANKVDIVFFDLDLRPVAKGRDFNRLPGFITTILFNQLSANRPQAYHRSASKDLSRLQIESDK